LEVVPCAGQGCHLEKTVHHAKKGVPERIGRKANALQERKAPTMLFSLATMVDPRFLAGFVTCLALWVLVPLFRRMRTIRLKPGTLEYLVEVDRLFWQTWHIGYTTIAEVPLTFADCGRTVTYTTKKYRVKGFYGDSTPSLESIR